MQQNGLPQEHHGFFGGQRPQEQPLISPQISTQLNSFSRRLKMLEESLENLRRKEQIDERNSLQNDKDQHIQIKALSEEIDELKVSMEDLKSDVRLIIKELQMCAKNEDVKVLQKYIDMWKPVQFTTVNQVQRIIDDEFRKRGH